MIYDRPDPNNINLGHAAYAVGLTRAFSINSIRRVIVYHLQSRSRTDVSEVLSLAANYPLASWRYVSAIGSFAHNDSNRAAFDGNEILANIRSTITL